MALPDWADTPIVGMSNAAKALGVSDRKLTDILKDFPFYETRGRTYVFYPEHITQLRAATCRSKSTATPKPNTSMPLEPSAETAYDKALKLVIGGKQKN